MIRHEVADSHALALTLTAEVASVGDARHRVSAFLDERIGAGGPTTDAELLVTEIVTNAVSASGGDLDVYLHLDHRSIRIWVSDLVAGPRRPPGGVLESDDDWGLRLVHTLASHWGVRSRVDGKQGKTVWAEVALDQPAAVQGKVEDVDEIEDVDEVDEVEGPKRETTTSAGSGRANR